MSNISQLKRRIKSIASTSQLTKAMQTVAAMRFKKNLAKEKLISKYSLSLENFTDEFSKFNLKDFNSPFIQRTGNKKLIVILGPTRGFCGGLHRSIANFSYRSLKEQNVDFLNPDQVNFITLNKPAFTQISRNGGMLLASFTDLPKNPDEYSLLAVSEYIYKVFLEDSSIGEVHFVYASDNSLEPIKYEQILPFKFKNTKNLSTTFELDSSVEDLFSELIHQYLQAKIQSCLMQTFVAEEKARMVAMNQATDNATKLKSALNLVYFKQRQAKITQEMSEIASNV